MGKRIIFIMMWALGFFVGSAYLLGGAMSGYEITTGNRLQPTSGFLISVGFVVAVIGGIGLVLGILGLLPGTGSTRRDNLDND